MPIGPKGEKRPADVIGIAVKVMRIAVGELFHFPLPNSFVYASVAVWPG